MSTRSKTAVLSDRSHREKMFDMLQVLTGEKPMTDQLRKEVAEMRKALSEDIKAPPLIARNPVEVTNLLYVYAPRSIGSRCPREDVIAHFSHVLGATLKENEYRRCYEIVCVQAEVGTSSQYREPVGCFSKGWSTMGRHQCEHETCRFPKPMESSAVDFQLKDANGQLLPFATNSLAVHYLVEHWDDIAKDKGHMERLNR